MSIRFQMNEDKAIEVLAWLGEKQPGIDVYHVAKVLYYADKDHLNRYGRPIVGDKYTAMSFGPVPSKIYDWIKKKIIPKRLEEAVTTCGEYLNLYCHRKPNMVMFSRTDIECLSKSLRKYGRLDFGKLTDMAHDERAWQEVERNKDMDYEKMIEQSPRGKKIIQDLREHSRQIAL